VSWHLHHSQDHNRSFALYETLFGWAGTDVRDMGPQNGSHQMFAWDVSGRTVGSMTSILSPTVHPQWLFFFPVADIENSLSKVRAGGGIALELRQTPGGDIVVPCDDPQGAAFALYQFA
jgi:predicted enzyme related to lactoylglutathione lyase